MPWLLLRDFLLFSVAVLGGGLALAPARPEFDRLEAWCIGVAGAVAILAGAVFFVHVTQMPLPVIAGGYAVLAGVAAWRWRAAVALARVPTVRETLTCWLLVAGGSLALLGCVFSYSGGGWMGDWEEHWHRPLMMLRLRPEDGFSGTFAFTSRPPLANAADAALLWVTGADYPRHQAFMLLLNSLAFLPVALWARTCGGGRAAAAAAGALLLINPLFLQNSTYPWTKLITAFFVLVGLHAIFAGEKSRARVVTGFALLALGVLTHYSACVWLVTAGAGWLWLRRAAWREWEFRWTAATAAGVLLLVLSPWLGHAIAHYGLANTLTSNTSFASASHYTPLANLLSIGPKLWNTLVPHFLRHVDAAFITQANGWARLRDEAFLVYQANFFWGAGSVALALLAATLLRPAWWPRPAEGRVWLALGLVVVVAGVAVHGEADDWGLAHICLQPLILLGVALAAARLAPVFRSGPPALTALVTVLAAADFFLGIYLHYAASALQLGRPAGQSPFEYVAGLNDTAKYNFARKLFREDDYLLDELNLPWWLLVAVMIGTVLLLVVRARRLARRDAVTRHG